MRQVLTPITVYVQTSEQLHAVSEAITSYAKNHSFTVGEVSVMALPHESMLQEMQIVLVSVRVLQKWFFHTVTRMARQARDGDKVTG